MSALKPARAIARATRVACPACLMRGVVSTQHVPALTQRGSSQRLAVRQFSDPRHNRRMKKLAKAERTQVTVPTTFDISTSFRLVKAMAIANFDETVEVAVNLGVDPRKPGQMVRSVVGLPHSFQDVTVAVFAKDAKAEEAKEAGADIVGGMDLVERIQAGDIPFDRCIATPDMMPVVGRVARILGPRGLMPNPKVGTVSMDVATAVRDAKGGQIAFRTEKAGVVHAPIGKASFTHEQLEENFTAFMKMLVSLQPPTMKGTYVKKAVVSSTMGRGVPIDLKSLPFKLEKSEF